MATKKKEVKVQDLKPSKDAKGGGTVRQQGSKQQGSRQTFGQQGSKQQGSIHQ